MIVLGQLRLLGIVLSLCRIAVSTDTRPSEALPVAYQAPGPGRHGGTTSIPRHERGKFTYMQTLTRNRARAAEARKPMMSVHVAGRSGLRVLSRVLLRN